MAAPTLAASAPNKGMLGGKHVLGSETEKPLLSHKPFPKSQNTSEWVWTTGETFLPCLPVLHHWECVCVSGVCSLFHHIDHAEYKYPIRSLVWSTLTIDLLSTQMTDLSWHRGSAMKHKCTQVPLLPQHENLKRLLCKCCTFRTSSSNLKVQLLHIHTS